MTAQRVLPAILSLLATTVGAQEYYQSDSLGLRGPAVSADDLDRYEWALLIEGDGEQTRQVLFQNGAEHHIEVTDRTGRLIAEELYADGELQVIHEYTYDDDLLLQRISYNSDRDEIARETFRYWRDGSLRSVESATSDQLLLFRYRDDALASEESIVSGAREQRQFDQFGRTALRTLWLDEEVQEVEEREYWGDPPAGLRQIRTTRGTAVELERFDESGRLIGSDRTAADGATGTTERIFEGDRVVEERENRDGSLFRTLYEYDGDELRTRNRYRDGELIQRIVFHAEEDRRRTETLFRDGVAILEIDYEDERRVEERVLRNGVVVRTRRFEPGES